MAKRTNKVLSAVVAGVVGVGLALPAAAADLPPNVSRVAGENRFATAAAFATARWQPGIGAAYVVNGTSFADALAAAPAASADTGPVLLTTATALPAETVAALKTLRPATIVVAGGTAAVADELIAELRAFTPGAVTRVAGASRYETAAALTKHAFDALPEDVPWAFVASGEGFADALGGASAAGAKPATPMLLTAKDGLPAATAAELRRLSPDRIYVLGGTAAISDAVLAQLNKLSSQVVRIAGADRYETAALLAREVFGSKPEVIVATGLSFADGLVAGAHGAPLLLLPKGSVPASVVDAIEEVAPIRATVLGGTGAVTDEQATSIGETIRDISRPEPTATSEETPPAG